MVAQDIPHCGVTSTQSMDRERGENAEFAAKHFASCRFNGLWNELRVCLF